MPPPSVVKHLYIIEHITACCFSSCVDCDAELALASVAGRSSRQPHCHGSFLVGSCSLPGHAPLGNSASHSSCTGYLDLNAPSLALWGFAAIPPSTTHPVPVPWLSWTCMDQPMTRRENRSTTTARYSQPSWVRMCVISVTHASFGVAVLN